VVLKNVSNDYIRNAKILAMRKGQIKNVGYLKDRRQQLRSNLTPAEATLWKYLKGGMLKGRKFRRQHSIENYIVDFYCPEEKLVIELDGEVHNDPIQSFYDFERSERLISLGNNILRFENKVVFADIDAVLYTIVNNFKTD
jgi:very-short-patch-repair endonuclease